MTQVSTAAARTGSRPAPSTGRWLAGRPGNRRGESVEPLDGSRGVDQDLGQVADFRSDENLLGRPAKGRHDVLKGGRPGDRNENPRPVRS